jgi:hypothetical protein
MAIDLTLYGLHNTRVTVSESRHGNPADQIDDLPAIGQLQPRTICTRYFKTERRLARLCNMAVEYLTGGTQNSAVSPSKLRDVSFTGQQGKMSFANHV